MRWAGLIVVLIGVMMRPAVAQDLTKIDAGTYKVEAENEFVRVVRMRRRPHGTVPMHDIRPEVVVFLTDVHMRAIGTNGKVVEVNKKSGDVIFNEGAKDSGEDLSDKPSEAVMIELKGPASSPNLSNDLIMVDPKHVEVEIDNDRVRVIRVHRGPHETSPMHSDPVDVVVFMTETRQTVTGKDGVPHDVNHRRGELSVNEPSTHKETNLNNTPMESIIVELK